MLDLVGEAIGLIFWENLPFMLLGVLIGMCVGILPGLGGTVGMSLVLPFIFQLDGDIAAAIALMIGMAAVIHTADTFPSVLLGVPGSSGSQATIMDGYPMARRGEAARALSAAFFASMIGGVIGAATLLAILPWARPIVLQFQAAEKFMLAVLGLSVVAILAGNRPVRGLISGMIGLMIGSIGVPSQQEDVYRYVFGQTYLWRGIPLAVLAMGLFALPEILDLLASGTSIAGDSECEDRRQASIGSSLARYVSDILSGLGDVIKNIFLVIRSSVLGVVVGFVPGLGGSVVDWISYGFARSTIKDNKFGEGDVRGVIAPESSNNAKEGGALIPTLLFSIPGSGTTAVLLSAFVILGLTPGRAMLDENKQLNVTVLIVVSLALANVFGTLACLSLSGLVAKLAFVKPARLAPFILVIMMVGAYQSRRNWGDFVAFLVIGLLGWTMRKLKYPLPPLLIGFVLAGAVEENLWLANSLAEAQGNAAWSWLGDPGPMIIGIVALMLIIGGIYTNRRTDAQTEEIRRDLGAYGEDEDLDADAGPQASNEGGKIDVSNEPSPNAPTYPNRTANIVFLVLLLGVFLWAGIEAAGFRGRARPFPMTAAFFAAGATSIELIWYGWQSRTTPGSDKATFAGDFIPSVAGISKYLAWLFAYFAAIWLVGMIAASAVFVGVFLLLEGKVKWWIALLSAVLTLIFLVSMEDIMGLNWPDSKVNPIPEVMEDWFPEKIPLINRLG